jgi:excisionase family DNA binding protein
VSVDTALAAVVAEALAPVVSEIRELRGFVETLRLPQFLSVAEVAERLSCSTQTVVAMARRSELAHRRAGRRFPVVTLICGKCLYVQMIAWLPIAKEFKGNG